jgi:hypothetical protein
LKVAYCPACKIVTAAGPLPVPARWRGRQQPYSYTHTAKNEVHECRLVDVPDTPQKPGETVDAWLARLSAKVEGA